MRIGFIEKKANSYLSQKTIQGHDWDVSLLKKMLRKIEKNENKWISFF